MLTSNHTNLQISFVHSRYRNENVAICVLVDVSARVKMEESLQEMAQAAEQASQSKSMFLATVSHELRTPLYGIIGNLDLLQTKALPKGVDRLVTAMNNSSSLLLKIISDILDFSKIESEQLKICLLYTSGAFGNIAQPQRVDAVERFELALQIPPARGDGFEFGDFSMIDVRGYRRFFGIHGRFYSFSVQTCEYISSAP